MKIAILLYAAGFSTLLVGMDKNKIIEKGFGLLLILISMLINAVSAAI